MNASGGTNRPGGRAKPAKYSGARVYGTLGGYTKALDWHQRGPAPDVSTPRVHPKRKRPPKGGQCQGRRMYGKVEGVCGLAESHHNHTMATFYRERTGEVPAWFASIGGHEFVESRP